MAAGTKKSVIHCKAAVTIDGFTIKGGTGTAYNNDGAPSYGGGICIADASPTIQNCTFTDNKADLGGGICIASESGTASPNVINCVFENNSAEKVATDSYGLGGAGIIVLGYNSSYSARANITNCTFKNNTVTGTANNNMFGGGVAVCRYNNGPASATITCSTFTGNSAMNGGGIFTNDDVILKNCTLINNSGYEIYVNNDINNSGQANAAVTANKSVIWNSTAITQGNVTKTNCVDSLTSAPRSSQESGAYGIKHTVFTIEKNTSSLLAKCAWKGTQIDGLTTDQLGRTFHNPPSIGAVELKPSVSITTASLPEGTIGQSYNASITATGTGSVSLGISGLPSGLSAASGTITGTPTVTGTFSITVTATSYGASTSKTLSLKINAVKPAITTSTLTEGKVGEDYSAEITATGTTPLTWTVEGLPEGLTSDKDTAKGTTLTITGKPNESGTFTVKVTSANTAGNSVMTFTLVIKAADIPAPANPDPETPETPEPETPTNPTDPTDQPETPTNPTDPTDQPETPTNPTDPTDQPETPTNPTDPTDQPETPTNPTDPTEEPETPTNPTDPTDALAPDDDTPPNITTKSLPPASTGDNYTAVVSASGSTPLTWEITGVPDGLDWADTIGRNTLITGQAGKSGEFAITISVTNSAGTDSKTLTLRVSDETDSTHITTSELPAGTQGRMYTFTLEASGTGQSSWTASGLPDGLTLEGMTITGTPAVYGEFEVIITVTNETGTDTRTFTLKIYDVSESLNRNAPEITSGAPADGYYKRFYSHTFTARGQTPITWHLSGNVPEGLEIDSGTGRFSGSPKQTGEFAFTVSAANKSGTRSETVKLRVLDVPASMLMYERVCSDPLVLRLSEQKGSGLKTAKIFRDNYRAFRSHRSKDSGATFVEFIAGTLMDYTASAQFSNMTSLISAVFRGFDKGADFYIEYPDNAHVSQSAMLSDSDSESDSESESQIPANIIIGTVGEAHAASLEELSALLSSDELAQITRLEFISSDIQELSRLEGFTGLKALSVRECPLLEQINLSGCASLESLIINNAAVIAIDVSDCVNLAYIDVNECASLETITGLNERLRTLKAAYTSLRELDLTGKGRLASLNLNETKLTSLDLTDCDSLEVISVLNAGNLAVLDLSQCASLVDVYAGGTMIEGFASRSHKSLRKLDLAGCLNLIEIDVANYELLDELVITGARITELDISNCPSLERVNANGCELLSALNHEGCDKLSELSLNGTLFSELDLSGMNALTKLDAGSCALLSELILDDCPNLQELLCPGCALVSLDLTGNNNLAVLDISMNAITNRNLALNSKSGLREFYCSGNSFAYLDLSALNLESAEFVNQTIYGFRSALSLDVGRYVNSEAVKVSNVQAFTQSGDVIPSEYNKSSGIARFEQAPFAVSYEYATGYDNNSVRMDVLLTGAEKPESSNGYLDGTNCGSCNAGFPFAGLAALCVLMFPVKSVKRKKQ